MDASGEDFYDRWLESQVRKVRQCEAGLLVAADGDGLHPVALWPDESIELAPLRAICEEVLEEQCALAMALPDDGLYALAVPTRIGGRDSPVAVCAMLVHASGDDDPVLDGAMQQLHWGSAWLALRYSQGRLQQANRDHARAIAASDLLAGVLSEPDFQSAGSRLVNELADSLHCDRVAYGDLVAARARVLLLSHSAQLGRRMNLVRAIEAAMDEARDQRRSLVWPPAKDDDPLILKSTGELASLGGGSVLTVPIHHGDGFTGAFCFERGADQPFDPDTVGFCEAITALAAPAIEEKRLNDRWLVVKAWDSLRRHVERLLGAGYPGRKVAVLGAVAIGVFFSVYQTDYNLAANATLEGVVQRAVIAPFDGYIADAGLRAGDRAEAGQVLATLDDRDLQLERLKTLSEKAQLERQLQEARGQRENARVNVINAQIEKTAAELDLVENRIERSRLKAPFSGLIIQGDLSQRFGGAVSKGETLFVMTPLDDYRIRMRVPERRIEDVRRDQQGELKLSAVPAERFAFRVTRIISQAIVADGATYFPVEAKLTGASDRLRPGMEGVAKIHVDRRLLIRIWTRDLLEWIRLKAWSFWG